MTAIRGEKGGGKKLIEVGGLINVFPDQKGREKKRERLDLPPHEEKEGGKGKEPGSYVDFTVTGSPSRSLTLWWQGGNRKIENRVGRKR